MTTVHVKRDLHAAACRAEGIGSHSENSLRSQHTLPSEGALHGRDKGPTHRRGHLLCPAVESKFSAQLLKKN